MEKRKHRSGNLHFQLVSDEAWLRVPEMQRGYASYWTGGPSSAESFDYDHGRLMAAELHALGLPVPHRISLATRAQIAFWITHLRACKELAALMHHGERRRW